MCLLLAFQTVRGFLLCVFGVLSIACMQADGSESAIMLHCMDVLSALAQLPAIREAWVMQSKACTPAQSERVLLCTVLISRISKLVLSAWTRTMYVDNVQLACATAVSRQARLFEYKAGAQEDNSPVGPLKVQLPDLTRDSDQDRVTVLTESQPHGHSEQLLLASAESSEEYDQQAGASAVPTTGSKGMQA